MRPDRPSLTATWVAAWRGLLGHDPDAHASDPVAEHLVPAPYAAIVALGRRFPGLARAVGRVGDRVSAGRSQHIVYRTRAIDDVLLEAATRGTRQMVLLGAGLDARAHRLPALAGFSVFELDHPATQGWKKQRVQPLVPIAARVAYVEADFEVDDDLDERLATAGYDATQPAAFVMEGVAMYLSARANDRVLAVAGNAAKGSKLAMTYFEPVPAPLAKALAQVLGGIREPVRTALSPDEAAALIGRHGFRRISDEGDPEWRARYDRRAQPWSLERLIVGERT